MRKQLGYISHPKLRSMADSFLAGGDLWGMLAAVNREFEKSDSIRLREERQAFAFLQQLKNLKSEGHVAREQEDRELKAFQGAAARKGRKRGAAPRPGSAAGRLPSLPAPGQGAVSDHDLKLALVERMYLSHHTQRGRRDRVSEASARRRVAGKGGAGVGGSGLPLAVSNAKEEIMLDPTWAARQGTQGSGLKLPKAGRAGAGTGRRSSLQGTRGRGRTGGHSGYDEPGNPLSHSGTRFVVNENNSELLRGIVRAEDDSRLAREMRAIEQLAGVRGVEPGAPGYGHNSMRRGSRIASEAGSVGGANTMFSADGSFRDTRGSIASTLSPSGGQLAGSGFVGVRRQGEQVMDPWEQSVRMQRAPGAAIRNGESPDDGFQPDENSEAAEFSNSRHSLSTPVGAPLGDTTRSVGAGALHDGAGAGVASSRAGTSQRGSMSRAQTPSGVSAVGGQIN